MRVVGLGWAWTDYTVGQKYRTVGRTVTETDVITFVDATNLSEPAFTNFDFQERHSTTPGRLVPGALCYCMAEGLLVQATLVGAGLALIELEQKLLKPVFVGDTIHVEVEILSVKPTSRGNRGIIGATNSVVNQKGECTQVYRTLRMISGEPFAG